MMTAAPMAENTEATTMLLVGMLLLGEPCWIEPGTMEGGTRSE